MVIIGVDYGDVRTGVAVCDAMEMLASPVQTLTETNPVALAEKLTDIARERKAQQFVMGLPKNMDGSEGFRAQNCRDFAEMLRQLSGIEVVFIDERLSTVYAHNVLSATNTRGKKRKQLVDTVSAVVILEDYLRQRRNKVNAD